MRCCASCGLSSKPAGKGPALPGGRACARRSSVEQMVTTAFNWGGRRGATCNPAKPPHEIPIQPASPVHHSWASTHLSRHNRAWRSTDRRASPARRRNRWHDKGDNRQSRECAPKEPALAARAVPRALRRRPSVWRQSTEPALLAETRSRFSCCHCPSVCLTAVSPAAGHCARAITLQVGDRGPVEGARRRNQPASHNGVRRWFPSGVESPPRPWKGSEEREREPMTGVIPGGAPDRR